MSNNIDNGKQIIFFDYKEEALGQKFNRVNYRLASHGIYEGGEITRIDDSTISLSPFVAYVEVPADVPSGYPAMGVRIQTTESATITLAGNVNKTLIVGNFVWSDDENNFMSFNNIADSELTSNDIIFGRVNLDGSAKLLATNYVNYNLKDWSYNYYYETLSHKPPFKVESLLPTVPLSPAGLTSKKLKVYPGTAVINGKKVVFATAQYTSEFTTITAGKSRKDILYIKDDGTFLIEEGAEYTSTPVLNPFNNQYLPIAIVTRTSENSGYVRGDDIEYLHPCNFMNGLPMGTSNSYFTIDTNNENAVRLVNNNGVLYVRNKVGNAFADISAKDGSLANLAITTLLTVPTIKVTALKHASSSGDSLTFLADGKASFGYDINVKNIISDTGNITATEGILTGKTLAITENGTVAGTLAITGILSTTTFKVTNIKHKDSPIESLVFADDGSASFNGALSVQTLSSTGISAGASSFSGTITTKNIVPAVVSGSSFDIGTDSNRFNYGYFNKCKGAVGNDFADVFNCLVDEIKYGKVYVEKNGKVELSSSYAQKGIIGITSDQYSFLAGDGKGLPIAVGGFLNIPLIYEVGTALTCGKDGSLVKANLFTKIFHPERIIAVVVGANRIKVR